jgi:hypothetical protein
MPTVRDDYPLYAAKRGGAPETGSRFILPVLGRTGSDREFAKTMRAREGIVRWARPLFPEFRSSLGGLGRQ